jgi:N utilization substance protein B
MGPRRKSRILAVQALFAYDFTHCGIEALTDFWWAREEASGAELGENIRSFASLLIAGTIENLEAVDQLIAGSLEHWDFKRLSHIDLAILRISVYSFLCMKDVPASVVIDEAVDIAKDFGADESYRFINGVLDGIRKSLESAHETA